MQPFNKFNNFFVSMMHSEYLDKLPTNQLGWTGQLDDLQTSRLMETVDIKMGLDNHHSICNF